jgi:hypothetical protein
MKALLGCRSFTCSYLKINAVLWDVNKFLNQPHRIGKRSRKGRLGFIRTKLLLDEDDFKIIKFRMSLT